MLFYKIIVVVLSNYLWLQRYCSPDIHASKAFEMKLEMKSESMGESVFSLSALRKHHGESMKLLVSPLLLFFRHLIVYQMGWDWSTFTLGIQKVEEKLVLAVTVNPDVHQTETETRTETEKPHLWQQISRTLNAVGRRWATCDKLVLILIPTFFCRETSAMWSRSPFQRYGPLRTNYQVSVVGDCPLS